MFSQRWRRLCSAEDSFSFNVSGLVSSGEQRFWHLRRWIFENKSWLSTCVFFSVKQSDGRMVQHQSDDRILLQLYLWITQMMQLFCPLTVFDCSLFCVNFFRLAYERNTTDVCSRLELMIGSVFAVSFKIQIRMKCRQWWLHDLMTWPLKSNRLHFMLSSHY